MDLRNERKGLQSGGAVVTGLQLQRARARAKVSLRRLAAHLRLSPSYLCDLEHGRRTSQQQLVRAAAGLNEMREAAVQAVQRP